MAEWCEIMVTTLGLNQPNIEVVKVENYFCFIFNLILLLNKKRRIALCLQEIMVDVGMFAKEKSHSRNHVNNEEGNLRESDIWVNLNESRNDNPSELQQTVKESRK